MCLHCTKLNVFVMNLSVIGENMKYANDEKKYYV
jgi:hypothetical protein